MFPVWKALYLDNTKSKNYNCNIKVRVHGYIMLYNYFIKNFKKYGQ